MGALKLVSPGPDKVYGVRAHPEPDWSVEGLLSELNSLKEKLKKETLPLVCLTECHQPIEPRKKTSKSDGKAFRMRIDDDEEEDSETEDKEITSVSGIVGGTRFGLDLLSCDDCYDDGSDFGDSSYNREEESLEKGSLMLLRQEFQNSVKEQIRAQVALFETELLNNREISESAILRIENYILQRKESERKLDTQYKQLIVDAIAKHIAALQRDHNMRSKMEEKKLQSDVDEARKRAIALEEERILIKKAEEKARAEEAAKLAALKEAENKKVEDIPKQILSNQPPTTESPIETHKPTEKVVLASKTALRIEQKRLQLLTKFEEQTKLLNMDFSGPIRELRRLVKQIRPLQQNVKEKANSIINIISNPSFPQSISLLTFAKNVVENCEKVDPFASAHVISLVASKVPQVVDLIFAVLHRSCAYTVPKHTPYLKTSFTSKEVYFKELGYLKEGDRFESAKDFLNRVKLYMTLYGAIVQIQGMESQGWAWLAMLMNHVPANRYSGYAACGFLETAGFGLFARYKGQFRKMMRVFREEFVRNLRSVDDSEVIVVIAQLEAYVDGESFTREPAGRRLQTHFISHDVFPQ